MIRDKILSYALAYHKNLQADDERFNNLVIIKSLDDMTTGIFDHAFVVKTTETATGWFYYIIFPEHSEPLLYHNMEYDVIQVKRIEIQVHKEFVCQI